MAGGLSVWGAKGSFASLTANMPEMERKTINNNKNKNNNENKDI